MKLTNRNVSGLSIPEGKNQKFYFDEELAGFGVRLSSGGTRTWIVQYRNKFGHTKRETIGKVGVLSATEARKVALKVLKRETMSRLEFASAVKIGKPMTENTSRIELRAEPPVDRKRKSGLPSVAIGVLIEPYLEHWKEKIDPKYLADVRVYFLSRLAPLHSVGVGELTMDNTMELLKDFRSAFSRSELRNALCVFYDWAIANGFTDHNPFTKKWKR